MRRTDEVDDAGTPAEKLRIYEYGHLCRSGLGDTYAGQYDREIIPLIARSAVFSPSTPARVGCLTQKPAFDIHLDSSRSATATVGRTSNGTDAPIISPLRVCTSSLGGRANGSNDIFGAQRMAAQAGASQFNGTVDYNESAAPPGSPILFAQRAEKRKK